MHNKCKANFRIDSLGPDSLYDYDLFAVIVHDGQIDNGHYTNFARSQDEVSMMQGESLTIL